MCLVHAYPKLIKHIYKISMNHQTQIAKKKKKKQSIDNG